MVVEAIEKAIAGLKQERERIDQAIRQLEAIAAERAVPPGKGERRASGGSETAQSRVTRGKNAPRGMLKDKMRAVLKGRRKPMRPVDLRDQVIAAGYPAKSPESLYAAIFAAARKDPKIKKVKDGYLLK